MMNKMCFEAFDRTLRDIMKNVDDANNTKPFGGKAVVLGGDFRQILPVINKGSRFDIIKAAINYSELPLMSLAEFVYPKFVVNMMKLGYFDDGAILCPTNDSVEEVNEFMLPLLGGEDVTYLSSDKPCQSDVQDEVQSEWFTSEFLNDIKCSRIPNHELKLKTGVPIMLLRNIDQAKGLCNGTRLQVNHLGKKVISATVIIGQNIGDKDFIPRVDLVPSDSRLPFKF